MIHSPGQLVGANVVQGMEAIRAVGVVAVVAHVRVPQLASSRLLVVALSVACPTLH